MTAKYSAPTVEVIPEDSEDDSRERVRTRGNDTSHGTQNHQLRPSGDTMIKANTGREREKRRSNRSGGNKHSKNKPKEVEVKRPIERYENERPRLRHRHSLLNRSSGSTSSEGEQESSSERRGAMANARARLTSPSMLSTLTSLTHYTNKSSGSSGSNSTVTQASVSKRSLGKRPEMPEAPMSPAVPDAPNVFSFLVTGSTTSLVDEDEERDHDQDHDGKEIEGSNDEIEPRGQQQPEAEEEGSEDESQDEIEAESHIEVKGENHVEIEADSSSESEEDTHDEAEEAEEQEGEESEEESEEEEGGDEGEQVEEDHHDSQWKSNEYTPSPAHLAPKQGSASSSTSSSIHGSDHFSEPAPGNDTDRSTSPERSTEDHTSDHEGEAPTDTASAKIASQIAAAHQRQNLYTNGAVQSFGTPNMARGTAVRPYVPQGNALTPRHTPHHVKQRSLPRAEKFPVTGYELLASRLSHAHTESEDGAKIKPMYRKFEALNHRLLLHLQDEISELEERLHRLDHADTQARTAGNSVVPASRRAAHAAGGELEWHKTDVLGRIGFKLAQYNQALAAFNTTQALNPPDPEDISNYRTYLSEEHPIAESETHFLDPTDDLVSVCSERRPHSNFSYSPDSPISPETQGSYTESVDYSTQTQVNTSHVVDDATQQPFLANLAVALAIAVLVPVMTFTVIPGFVGRMTVVGLVAGGVLSALMQNGVPVEQGLVGRDGLVCAGVYLGVMGVVAEIVG